MQSNIIKPAFVGVDPSLNSTAVCIELTDGTEFFMNYAKLTKHSQWMKRTTDCVAYHLHSFTEVKEYSPSEVVKVMEYGKLAADIALRLATRKTGAETLLDGLQGAVVAMEGYSYGSSAGPLIDLVTFGSELRRQLINAGAELHIVSPMALKVAACKLAYGVDKKGISRNDIGLAGGKFTKNEMFRAMYKYERANPLKTILSSWEVDINGMKNTPKPVDDLVDAYWLCQVAKSIKSSTGLTTDDISSMKATKD